MGKRSSSQRGRRRAAAHPDWRHLPAPALLCVCHHLPDLAAFFAFAGTCREWRDVANFGKKAFMDFQPPLLCTTDGKRFYSPVDAKSYKNRRVASIVRRLRGSIMDVSQGYLVIEADCALREKKLVLLNPFTQHRVGGLPRLYTDFVFWLVLTAPPTSPDCVAVACSSLQCPRRWTWGRHDLRAPCSTESIEYARPGDAKWTTFERGTSVLGTFKPVASADGKVYAWATAEGDDQLELVVMEFLRGEEPKLTRLHTVAFTDSSLYPVCLAEPRGGDQLLLVVRASFVSPDGSVDVTKSTFEIYRLDAPEQPLVQKSDGLGGRALVMDYFSCMVADNPAGWGGRGDDVYFSVGHGSEAWRLGLKDATTASYFAPRPADRKRYYDRALWLLPADTCS